MATRYCDGIRRDSGWSRRNPQYGVAGSGLVSLGTVRLTKYGHACVRLDLAGGSVVLDPGTYSPDADLAGVADVLVTHEHADHLDVDRLVPLVRGGVRLHTTADVAAPLATDHGVEVHAVGPGETFTVAGVDVQVVGGQHAEIYDGLPACANVGFVLAGVYHPGDALHVPDVEVETLLVPVSAPWLKLREALDFVRAVGPARALPIHDAMFSDIGNAGVDRWMVQRGGTDYARLAPGESTELA
jgi:L-ascorbate metabolism protein UlaG (beta-lactamase superfamily)